MNTLEVVPKEKRSYFECTKFCTRIALYPRSFRRLGIRYVHKSIKHFDNTLHVSTPGS